MASGNLHSDMDFYLDAEMSVCRQQSSQYLGTAAEVFHQFSGVASTSFRAASPVVPGLFVVAMAVKELDNIIWRNQATDVGSFSTVGKSTASCVIPFPMAAWATDHCTLRKCCCATATHNLAMPKTCEGYVCCCALCL